MGMRGVCLIMRGLGCSVFVFAVEIAGDRGPVAVPSL